MGGKFGSITMFEFQTWVKHPRSLRYIMEAQQSGVAKGFAARIRLERPGALGLQVNYTDLHLGCSFFSMGCFIGIGFFLWDVRGMFVHGFFFHGIYEMCKCLISAMTMECSMGSYTYTYTHIHTYIHACMHAYIHTCIHTCMHACMHACMHTYIHTYITIRTYIHTYIYIYIYTYIYIHMSYQRWRWDFKGIYPINNVSTMGYWGIHGDII